MPALFILAGSNGAGKSTIGPSLLPPDIATYYTIFDGDKLALEKRTELWNGGLRVSKEVRRIADEYVADTFAMQVDHAIADNNHFAYEGHFPQELHWNTPKRFKEAGYEVHMIYMGLENPDMCQLRVTQRVSEGKHNVPRLEIDNNFFRNLFTLNEQFQLLDSLQIFDTSNTFPQLLLHIQGTQALHCVPKQELPDWFREFLPAIVERYAN